MVTLNDTPWAGLELGKIDSRRFDAFGKWNFFWTIMAKADPALTLTVGDLPSPPPVLPKLRSIDTGIVALPGGPAFYIRLKDHAQIEIFETLCRNVVAGAQQADNEADALNRTIGRTFRWHHLLRGGRSDLLSEEEQKGLVGELIVLERLSDLIGPRAAVTAWRGPSGAPKDFELHGHCIEVKARRSAAQPYVHISNEFQLSDVTDHRLWLAVLAVERVAEPFGHSLDVFVSRIASRFLAGDPMVAIEWEQALAATGYREEDDYSAFRWVCTAPAWYEVTGDFPRIVAPVPVGVVNVRYALALGACVPFEVVIDEAEAVISEGYADV
jgi:hypothetical protein